MTPDYLDIAIRATDAGLMAISTVLGDGGSLDIRHKGVHDVVTRADIAAEQAIVAEILRHRPDDAILGEEGTAGDAPMDPAGRPVWIIDPIDGTTNFAHGVPVYAISIACWVDGHPMAAVVHCPPSGERFTAESGHGAYLNGRRIRVSDITDPGMALLGTGFPYRDLSLMEPYLNLFRRFMRETQGVRRPGSASLDLCFVAAGRYDGFYEYALAPWDVAAGALIVREAGGVVSDWTAGGNWLHGRRIIAANPAIHEYLLRCIVEELHPDSLES
jgi:myo-inositol-1(or 4)-monophosphatase